MQDWLLHIFCKQVKLEDMKLLCLLILGLMPVSCGVNYANNSLHCGVYTQQTCPISACMWSGTDCVAYSECSDVKNVIVCREMTFKNNSCKWTPNSKDGCIAMPSVSCTLSTKGSYCCAGTDTSCIETDFNCIVIPTVAPATGPTCNLKTPTVCSYDSVNNLCCSGTGTTCTVRNPNCGLDLTAGTCSDV